MSPRTRRSFAFGAAFVLAASALTAAPVAAQEESSLIYAIDGEISYLSNANSDVPSAEAVQWLYNGLFMYDDTLTPVPDLAAGPWQISEDGLTWTIQIKDNAYFQPTGEQLTAQDVVFTYQLANSANCRFNPDTCLGFVTITPEGATEPVNVLQDVKAIDDFTVEFTLAVAQLAWWDGAGWAVEPGAVRVLIGSSSDDIRLQGEVVIVGTDCA